ncbi:hypothetical protein AK812_SmicGene38614 [Symbiodinium microadriaticum]|uniref:Uncharacterized protein n=1 Tax=Symbiodinium microadriaticum TaxID=2951 RepID=A0A1Q9CDA6_SYMMI|nr:hypothetical protein AK812_SmicGene38614 [Symbiodinium microadriaticum]
MPRGVPGTGYIAVDADEESKATVDISGTENLTYEDILANWRKSSLFGAKIQWTGDILAAWRLADNWA